MSGPQANLPEEQNVVRWKCGDETCKSKGSYRVAVACTNCGWKGWADITKGHEFSKYSISCPSCGCSTLSRAL